MPIDVRPEDFFNSTTEIVGHIVMINDSPDRMPYIFISVEYVDREPVESSVIMRVKLNTTDNGRLGLEIGALASFYFITSPISRDMNGRAVFAQDAVPDMSILHKGTTTEEERREQIRKCFYVPEGMDLDGLIPDDVSLISASALT